MSRAGNSVRAAVIAAGVALTGTAHADPGRVEWSEEWPRVKWWEVAAALSLTVGDTEFEDHVPLPTRSTWNSPILFDSWARSVFRGRTAAIQSFASTSTDIMYKVGALVPFLV